MDLQKIKRLLLIFICFSCVQTVLAATDATRLNVTQRTTAAPGGATETRLTDNTSRGNTSADASATTQTTGAAATTTSLPTTSNVSSTDNMTTKNSTAGGGAGGAGGGGTGGGGAGAGAGSGAAGNATTVSMPSAGNDTARTTISPTVSPILCSNCSGDNCRNISNDNSSSTCTSNTGTCYIQYDTVAKTMTLACKPLYATSGTCMSENAWQAAKTSCEICCQKNRCNDKWKTMEVELKCLLLLRSSATRCLGLSATLFVLIAAIRWHSFFSLDITSY